MQANGWRRLATASTRAELILAHWREPSKLTPSPGGETSVGTGTTRAIRVRSAACLESDTSVSQTLRAGGRQLPPASCDRYPVPGIQCCALYLSTITSNQTASGRLLVPASSSSALLLRFRRSGLWGYALAAVAVALAGLLIWVLRSFGVAVAGSVLLLPVAVGFLYAGTGPGLLALAASALISRDPVVLVVGALLGLACESFRRRTVA